MQGDVVVRQEDPGNVMYFVGEGSLEVRLYAHRPTAGRRGGGGAYSLLQKMPQEQLYRTHTRQEKLAWSCICKEQLA